MKTILQATEKWNHSVPSSTTMYNWTTVSHDTTIALFSATHRLRSYLMTNNYPRLAQALSKIYIEDFLRETTTRKKANNSWLVIQSNIGTNSKGRPTSSRKSTTLHRPTPTTRVQEHPIQRVTTGSSSRYMDHISEAYGKQQQHQIPPATNLRCTRLPPTKIRTPS